MAASGTRQPQEPRARCHPCSSQVPAVLALPAVPVALGLMSQSCWFWVLGTLAWGGGVTRGVPSRRGGSSWAGTARQTRRMLCQHDEHVRAPLPAAAPGSEHCPLRASGETQVWHHGLFGRFTATLLAAACATSSFPPSHTTERSSCRQRAHARGCRSPSGYSRSRRAVTCDPKNQAHPSSVNLPAQSTVKHGCSTVHTAVSATATASGQLHVLPVCELQCCSGICGTWYVCQRRAILSSRHGKVCLLSAPLTILHSLGKSCVSLSSVCPLRPHSRAVSTGSSAGQPWQERGASRARLQSQSGCLQGGEQWLEERQPQSPWKARELPAAVLARVDRRETHSWACGLGPGRQGSLVEKWNRCSQGP